jgi:hypothetical protein
MRSRAGRKEKVKVKRRPIERTVNPVIQRKLEEAQERSRPPFVR